MDVCLSPLDSRYYNKIKYVARLFCNENFTIIKIHIEVEYLKFLLKYLLKNNLQININIINSIFEKVEKEPSVEIKKINDIEKQTNHDVQAIVQYLKQEVPCELIPFVHFGLTSQDINSPAMVITYKTYVREILIKDLDILEFNLNDIINKTSKNVMLSFTHGQPATPTTFGKQMNIFLQKILKIKHEISTQYVFATKMGGSNGSLSALKSVYPEYNWDDLIELFLRNRFELERNKYTSQIDDYTNYYKLFQIFQRICVVLINLCQDMWLYCSKKYLKLRKINNEVGSSAMPHKINPIHFENAEGNLKLCIDMFESIGRNICINRLQRDLTDSTMLRNVGVACGHLTLAIRNISLGLERIELNTDEIEKDLNENSIVVMEFIQLKMRHNGFENAYDLCKEYSRGKSKFNFNEFIEFLSSKNININEEIMNSLDINLESYY